MSENRLYEAAASGDERSVEELLEQDPLLLDKVSYSCSNKTLLHVATARGHLALVQIILKHNPDLAQELNSQQTSALHVASSKGYLEIAEALISVAPDMCLSRDCQGRNPLHLATIKKHLALVRVILNHNPELAQELDSQQRSALHVASSKGYLEIVGELLSVAPHMCLSRDCRGWNPLHLAAMKGHVEVLKELERVYPLAARTKLDRGMTVLHLCVEYRQLEAFKMLVKNFNEMVNAKDDKGETVLHMAVSDRQIETVKFLLSVTSLEVNGLNLNRMTALDVLIRSKRNVRDPEIEEYLKRSLEEKGGVAHKQNNFNHHYEWLHRKRGSLMVAASLIATMAFQVAVNPPGGVWQDDKIADSTDVSDDGHEAGLSILRTKYPSDYTVFYVINTIGFLASLSIILLLMSGLPLRRRFFMWFLMVVTWIAITAIAFVYMSALMILSLDFPTWPMSYIWIGLMTLLVIANTARLTVKLVKNLRQRGGRGIAGWFQGLFRI